MSGTAAKASRRDIRKAFGPDAVDALNRQAEAIDLLGTTSASHAYSTAKLLGELTDGVKALERIVHGRGFWGRLRWLVTGR